MVVDAVVSLVGVGLGDAVVEAVLAGGEAIIDSGPAIAPAWAASRRRVLYTFYQKGMKSLMDTIAQLSQEYRVNAREHLALPYLPTYLPTCLPTHLPFLFVTHEMDHVCMHVHATYESGVAGSG